MTEISDTSKQIITQFLQDWWHDLTRQAHETVAGAQLPILDGVLLYEQLLGHELRIIAAAAEGLLPDDDDARDEAQGAAQSLCEWMWARPGMPSAYHIPPEWWGSPMGNLALRAHFWAGRDELITLSQAAKIAGRSIGDLSNMIRRGRISGYPDPSEPNPTHRTRVSRREIAALPAKRQSK